MADPRRRGDHPGILTLLELIEEHRGAFEYDWRNRFGLGLSAVPKQMAWGEAVRLTKELANDRSSRVGAALAGWQYPASLELLTALNTFDWLHKVYARKPPRPMMRPWDEPPRRIGSASIPLEHAARVMAEIRQAAMLADQPANP